MPTELTDALTVLNKPDLAVAMYHAWDSFFGQYPKKESLWVVLAQIQLETGSKYCHNWNLGNCKSIEGDGHDYQYYGCGEAAHWGSPACGSELTPRRHQESLQNQRAADGLRVGQPQAPLVPIPGLQ